MFQFTEDCLTGIREIDEEHSRLFEMINQAFQLLRDTKEGPLGTVEVQKLVQALREYAHVHFAHEEAYMQKIRDPELPRQKREHAAFLEKVNGIDLDSEEYSGRKAMEELLEYLSRWLYRHILGSDLMIGKMGAVNQEDAFAFTKEYQTGIRLVDEEHKRLFELIKEANDVVHAEFLHDKYDEIMRILEGLKEYTVLHFRDEEAYMERIAYEGLTAQRNAHQSFIDKLEGINPEELDDNQDAYLDELIDFLLSWLTNHILLVDKKIPVVEAENVY